MIRRAGSILPVNVFIGHDGKRYLDLAVDSNCTAALAWVRRRIEDGRYFLIVSTVCGHVLKKELTLAEARELYLALPDRLPVDKAFPRAKSTPKKVDAAAETAQELEKTKGPLEP
jgi:hypothetical protein